MEEENQVFGHGAENKDDFNSEEKFNIYHKDKEDAEKNLQASAKDLEDFFDSLIKDEPDPTEEEVNEGIRKILERAYPEGKSNKSKKVALKVLFIAALLSVLSFSCLFAIGNSHNISIENGFVTFAKDTVKIVFFGEEKEQLVTIDALMDDLESHGYKDIMFPQEFVTKSDEYMANVPKYIRDLNNADFEKQVEFDVCSDICVYSFSMINNNNSTNVLGDFMNLDNAETVVIDNTYIYVFELDSGFSAIRFKSNGVEYIIDAEISLLEMIEFAKTFAKME